MDCLFIDIKVKILCFRIQKSGIRDRAVKQSLITRRLVTAYRGYKGLETSIGTPQGSFQQSGGSVRVVTEVLQGCYRGITLHVLHYRVVINILPYKANQLCKRQENLASS